MGSCNVQLVVGDITEFSGDAIVNPANIYMIMGGGVAGALRRKGGREIEDEARSRAPVPIGKAIATGAGRLKAKYVIHAPTVEEPGGASSPEKVYLAAKAALEVAAQLGVGSMAFPLMGAGVGGLSPEESLRAMMKAFREAAKCPNIYIYLLSSELLERLKGLL
ncbi:MAG: macro domain-containing protein [Thermoproteus sp.]|nr:macro domain-containing protein [Thermoproteus sp.]